MNNHEIMLSVMIDFSKAFDTIDHRILLNKLIQMNFSNRTIKIFMSYLSNRNQFVQIDDKSSEHRPVFFGVPQGSILGPILFNMYVAEIPICITSKSIQYADDTTIYESAKECDAPSLLNTLERDISNLSSWSDENSLVFNNDKLKFVTFSRNPNKNKSYLLRTNMKSIEQNESTKLLGITFDEKLNWSEHVNTTLKSCYSILRTLKSFKRFASFKVRKSLAESLLLSRLKYNIVVYGQLPQYMLNRLQRLQNCAAGYVLGRFAKENDILLLNWLPIREYIDFAVSRATHQALHSPFWPSYLRVETFTYLRVTRLSQDGVRIKHGVPYSFQDQARVFNILPKSVREQESLSIFTSQVRKFYRDKAIVRLSL